MENITLFPVACEWIDSSTELGIVILPTGVLIVKGESVCLIISFSTGFDGYIVNVNGHRISISYIFVVISGRTIVHC